MYNSENLRHMDRGWLSNLSAMSENIARVDACSYSGAETPSGSLPEESNDTR